MRGAWGSGRVRRAGAPSGWRDVAAAVSAARRDGRGDGLRLGLELRRDLVDGGVELGGRGGRGEGLRGGAGAVGGGGGGGHACAPHCCKPLVLHQRWQPFPPSRLAPAAPRAYPLTAAMRSMSSCLVCSGSFGRPSMKRGSRSRASSPVSAAPIWWARGRRAGRAGRGAWGAWRGLSGCSGRGRQTGGLGRSLGAPLPHLGRKDKAQRAEDEAADDEARREVGALRPGRGGKHGAARRRARRQARRGRTARGGDAGGARGCGVARGSRRGPRLRAPTHASAGPGREGASRAARAAGAPPAAPDPPPRGALKCLVEGLTPRARGERH
jgi:hypothetical protein